MSDSKKEIALRDSCQSLRSGSSNQKVFEVDPSSFRAIPGAPFAYWVSDKTRQLFSSLLPFQSGGRLAASGGKTLDDFRFIRASWEVLIKDSASWKVFAKGGIFSPYYADIFLRLAWHRNGESLKAYLVDYRESRGWSPNWTAELHSADHYFRPGVTWPRRTNGLSFRALPTDSIFGDKGPAALALNDDRDELLLLMGILNSKAFAFLVSLQLARTELAQSFEVGVVQNTPIPKRSDTRKEELISATKLAWARKRSLDFFVETSSAFHLPAALLPRIVDYDPLAVADELSRNQAKIDSVVFDLYGFDQLDRTAALGSPESIDENPNGRAEEMDEIEEDDSAVAIDQTDGLLSWGLGVAFGRFDWRLATGEREAPPEPDPFDPLPTKSPGMLPDSAASFHEHGGILVDDQGHPHDLPRLIEEVLARVQADVPGDVRRWLQRDFFPLHVKQYSKSRRKAPIYWPLSTTSGSYTIWVYYPRLTSQTLYTAVNDFVEPKLRRVSRDAATLRDKGAARTREDEKTFEALQTLELELIELRDTLLAIASTYRPNHDDGVQITAAPLRQLFRHKPWQTALNDIWAKLKESNYDWAHLAMAYWPDRVREKCKTNKSLAIAHDLEHLYIAPEPKAAKPRSRKKASEA